jgi:hypothetical protein
MCLVLAGIASGIILVLLRRGGKVPPFGQYSWIAHPAWMNMVCAALAAAAAGVSSHWFARRAGFWGFWLGAVLLLALSAELLAGLRPGMGFLSLLTAGIAVIAVMPCLRTNPSSGAAYASGAAPSSEAAASATVSSWSMDFAALAPAWMIFALMIPLVSLLYGAVGSVAWLIDTMLFSLGATLLLPLLATASATLRRRIIAVAVTASFLGVVITFILPTYSAAWPQRVNFEYQLDADKHESVWAAEPDSLKLPAAVAAAAGFDAKPQRRFLGGWTQAFYAPAPWSELKPPLLTLRGVQAESAGITRYNVHLQSMRGAPEVEVSFPGAARIREIILNDGSEERHMPLFDAKNGETRLHVVGLAPSGMDFAVDVRGNSLQAHLFDQSYALPGGEFLQRLRLREATSSQDGDTTIVQGTVMLDPTAGR